MTVSDIRRHLTKLISEKLKIKVYSEDISKVTRPSIYIRVTNSQKESLAHYREQRKIGFDLIYFPTVQVESCNNEIMDVMENLNLAFENYGCRTLKVLDRHLTLHNVTENITDNTGHFQFDVEFIQKYGQEKEYEKMLELETNL